MSVRIPFRVVRICRRPTATRFRRSANGRRVSVRSAIPPLDGNIESSPDGDLTLTFDDGSTLRTHSFLLKLASPVFNTLFSECEKIEALALEGTSKETWTRILNRLHPAVQSLFLDFDPMRDTKQLVRRRRLMNGSCLRAVCPSRRIYWSSRGSSNCIPCSG